MRCSHVWPECRNPTFLTVNLVGFVPWWLFSVSQPLTSDLQTPSAVAPSLLRGNPSPRLAALDWTKGALVVFMVVYHAINYSPFRPLAFEYLAFLPPSFILIAGFVVGQLYATKYDLTRWSPYGRLLLRGFKLIALFTFCNLVLHIFESRAFGWAEGVFQFADHAAAIYLVGNGRVAIFEVLLPIGYFLLVAPLLVYLSRYSRWSVVGIAVAAFGLCVWLENHGRSFDHLTLFSCGLFGMALGSIPIKSVNALASRWAAVVPIYLVYRVLSYWLGERYAVQIFGACATLLLLYAIALQWHSGRWLYQHVVQLGVYSLFAYFTQIVLLQILVRWITGQPQHPWSVAATIAFTLLCTSAAAVLVARFRARSPAVNAAYKTIFA